MRIFTLLFLLFAVQGFSQTVILCDQASGAAYLSEDPTDNYYDMVNSLELAIQLKNDTLHTLSDAEAIEIYRASYNTEVLTMNDAEKEKVSAIMQDCIDNVNKLNDALLVDTIRMIMVEGKHYGVTTFFTRGNSIVFSQGSLNNMPEPMFQSVMYHELSHIISRYHTELKDELYGTFGYEILDKPALLLSSFERQLLYNPDGVQCKHFIELDLGEEGKQKFVPLISTRAPAYNPKAPTFFQYLHFQLYPIDDMGDVYFVRDPALCDDLDQSKIMAAYFARITNNTQYIIHPDEILADNFVYLFRSEEENAKLDQKLHLAIKNLYSAYKK